MLRVPFPLKMSCPSLKMQPFWSSALSAYSLPSLSVLTYPFCDLVVPFLPLWLLMTGPLGLLRVRPMSVVLNFLSP